MMLTFAAVARALLATAAPAPEYVARSTLGRAEALLDDIAKADAFLFASDDEAAALADWRERVARSRRDLQAVREGHLRGLTLEIRYRLTLIEESLRELEEAIAYLEGEVRGGLVRRSPVASPVVLRPAGPRGEVHAVVRRLVLRVEDVRAFAVG